jgi:hypothetical protein
MNKHCTLSWYNQRVFNHVRMQGMENFEITVKVSNSDFKMHICKNVTNLFNNTLCSMFYLQRLCKNVTGRCVSAINRI